MTFLLAGHETTAAALCFALQLLSTHPHVQALVVEEVRTLSDGGWMSECVAIR